MAFACTSSENMTILAGKIDNSVVEILPSESVDLPNINAATLNGSTKEDIISQAQSGVDLSSYATNAALSSHTGNQSNPHNVTKAQLGLGNVDNTADSQKSVNYANSSGTSGSATSAANIDPGTASLKNIYAGTGDIGAGAGLATGTIYLVYE